MLNTNFEPVHNLLKEIHNELGSSDFWVEFCKYYAALLVTISPNEEAATNILKALVSLVKLHYADISELEKIKPEYLEDYIKSLEKL